MDNFRRVLSFYTIPEDQIPSSATEIVNSDSVAYGTAFNCAYIPLMATGSAYKGQTLQFYFNKTGMPWNSHLGVRINDTYICDFADQQYVDGSQPVCSLGSTQGGHVILPGSSQYYRMSLLPVVTYSTGNDRAYPIFLPGYNYDAPEYFLGYVKVQVVYYYNGSHDKFTLYYQHVSSDYSPEYHIYIDRE